MSTAYDETDILSKLDKKLDRDLNNIYFPESGQITQYNYNYLIEYLTDKILYDRFAIIYPYGSKEVPGTIALNSTYVVQNPFPGYIVKCKAELLYNSEWGVADFKGFYASAYYGHGVYIYQHNDYQLVLKTSKNYLVNCINVYDKSVYPTSFPHMVEALTVAPFRVKVWKVGKIKE